jgi:pimeloyl-ACP methyl ester carboxylesterase
MFFPSLKHPTNKSRLAPHENPKTDIILVGHSMGGIVAAEVTLLPPQNSSSLAVSELNGKSFRHRILGTINLDVPFLGAHPGVISSGLASIFNPPRDKAKVSPASSSSSFILETQEEVDEDPNFNPRFPNDGKLPPSLRPLWSAAGHYITKYTAESNQFRKNVKNIGSAAGTFVSSHLEFGGALADYRGLWIRYERIRELEDRRDASRRRFVSYWTACAGYPKRDESPGAKSDASNASESRGRSRVALEQQFPGEANAVSTESQPDKSKARLASLSPMPMPRSRSPSPIPSISISDLSLTTLVPSTSASSQATTLLNWPPLPSIPMEPTLPDLSIYPEKAMQDTLKRQYERDVKLHQQILKNRKVSLSERIKAEEKMRKSAEKATKKQAKEPQPTSTPSIMSKSDVEPAEHKATKTKPPKERHFCILPPKDKATGLRDPNVWVKVDMGDIDEVAAHCGIFDSKHEVYEKLVGDVSSRVESWVRNGV